MRAGYSLELASPGDLPEVVDIDDDASTLYAEAGVILTLGPSHPFTVAEQRRWLQAAAMHRLFFARDESGARVGIAALDRFDGASYLDQLSVRRTAMRKGAGRFLLRHAIAWARANHDPYLWLTTYAHLPFNRRFYESEGFTVMAERECAPGIRHHLDDQRRWLTAPGERVAMRRSLATVDSAPAS